MSNKVKLTRIESTHNNLRTDSVKGVCFDFPVVGEAFTMYGGTLTGVSGVRAIITSSVEWIKMVDGDFIFKTKNSLYELEVGSEETEQQVEAR